MNILSVVDSFEIKDMLNVSQKTQNQVGTSIFTRYIPRE